MSDDRRPLIGLRLSEVASGGASGVDPRLHPAVDLDRPTGHADPAAAAPGDEQALAAELFVHGLMAHLTSDVASDRERRVRLVMSALPSRAVATGGRVLLPAGEGMRAVQVAAAAMLLAAVGALSVFAASGEQSATAIVQRSIAASGAAGDRTYSVMPLFDEGEGPDLPPARLDLRDGAQHRFAATLPDGRQLIAGRDVDGPWIIDHEGRVQRFVEGRGGPRPPRWIDLGESLFLAQSIDDLLAALPQDFSLRSISSQPLPGGDGTPMQRVTARSMGGFGPDPRRIELWIAPDSGVVHRMELHWDGESPGAVRGARREPWQGPPGCGPRGGRPSAGDGGPRSRGGFQPGGGCGPDVDGVHGIPDRFGPTPPDGEGPPPDMGQGGGVGPPPREPRGGQHPGGLAPPPEGARRSHAPPMGDGSILRSEGGGPPRHRLDGARRRGDAPPLLAAPGSPGPRGQRPPRFVERPPEFGRGDRPPPPRTMVFELVSTDPLPPGWFSPQPAADESAAQ